MQTISQTCELIYGQIKANLDYNLVNMEMFQPLFQRALLVNDVLQPVLNMLSV